MAPNAMIHIPALRGKSDNLSWLPPYGKIPMHFPSLSPLHTFS